MGGAIWAVLALVVALDLFDGVVDRLRAYRNRHAADAVDGEPAEPENTLAGRLLRRDPRMASRTFRPVVPVPRTWNEGRLNEPPEE